MRMRSAIASIGLLAVVACSASVDSAGSPSPGATELTPEQAAKPAVEITYPEAGGERVPAGDVLVALTVRSFELVDRVGKQAKAGEGHLVYYLDVTDIPTKADRSAIATGTGRSKASALTSHTWEDVAPGPHTLGAQLVNNDDTPLEPPVTDEIRVVVRGT